MIDMKQVADEVIKEKKESLQRQINTLNSVADKIKNGKWKDPKPMLKKDRLAFSGISSASGIYMIIHYVPGGKSYNIFYIGQSKKIAGRKKIHSDVFKNKGNPINYYSNSQSVNPTSHADSVVGRKMYNKDPNSNNWFFTYFELDNDWNDIVENHLIYKLLPEGNDIKMAGV